MRAFRRTLALSAVAATALAGCTSAPERPDPLPVARSQSPSKGNSSSAGYLAPPAALTAGRGPLTEAFPPPDPTAEALPINLATALHLGNARPLDVQIAGRQVAVAAAQYDRAQLLWVPNLVLGTDYFHHAGPQQNFEGALPKSNRSTFMVGVGPNLVFAFSEAIYAPLAARQDLRARQAAERATGNDAVLTVAEAYFTVQQARGELAGATAAVRYAEELTRRATELAKGLAPPTEESRAKVELARRKQAATSARERWRVSAAELARLLRLDPTAIVEPAEPPFLPVTLIDPTVTIDGLVPIALTNRPELAGHQAVVQATLARLKQERIRPLVPSVAIRSVSTNPSGSLGYGVFGGGKNDDLKNFAGRFDIDMQLLWEFQALGLGNRARVNERSAEHQLATLELFRTQDRVAAEVVQAFAQVRAAAERINDAEPALRESIDLVTKSLEGLGQTRRVGEVLTLVIRPLEAVAAVQAFAQANTDFHTAVADYNRAQFRLYRALGHPAQCLAGAVPGAVEPLAELQPPTTFPAQPAPGFGVPRMQPNPPAPLPLPQPQPVSVMPPAPRMPAPPLMPVPPLAPPRIVADALPLNP